MNIKQLITSSHIRASLRRLRIPLTLALGATVLAGCGLAGPSSTASSSTVIVGSKNFTENEILAQMMSDLLKADTKLHVETKLDLGGTSVAFNALKTGQISMYPDYTGTGYMDILKKSKPGTEQGMYNYVQKVYEKKYQLEWLKPFGFNDTYAMVVSKSLAKKDHLKTVGDLAKVSPTLVAGIDPECQNRPDCLPGLVKTYGLHFKSIKTMDHSLVEEAMGKGDIQATDAYSTDGGLIKYHLTVLKDTKHFFPAYDAAPVVQMSLLKAHPEVKTVLNKLAGKINAVTMQQLNYEVSISKQSIKQVAHNFLVKQGLLKS